MPFKDAKFSSEYLPQERMHAALLAVPGVLLALIGEAKVIASYAWGANIHSDLWYKPMREDTRRLQYLIEDSIDQRIVVPGESDLWIEVPENRLQLRFCHESDIHLDGSDDALLQRFMAMEPFSQMHWHTQDEVEKMIPEL